MSLPYCHCGVGRRLGRLRDPASIVGTARDFRGNSRCELTLRGVATGNTIDIGTLTKDRDTVTLRPEGSPLVYLYPDVCIVQIAAG